jgi:hypothetical protein
MYAPIPPADRTGTARRWRRVRLGAVGLMATLGALSLIPAGAPAASAAAGCVSTADCLSKMTLAEKAGQMTQVANTYIRNKNDIATYGLGSVLSGGGGGPNGAGDTAGQWADMVDNFQSYALNSRLGIPLIYGVDAYECVDQKEVKALYRCVAGCSCVFRWK